MLVKGLPRPAARTVHIAGGVATNFTMPDVRGPALALCTRVQHLLNALVCHAYAVQYCLLPPVSLRAPIVDDVPLGAASGPLQSRYVDLVPACALVSLLQVFSIGLGGGSVVRFQTDVSETGGGAGDGGRGAVITPATHVPAKQASAAQAPGSGAEECTIGPDSVGSRLLEEAVCMGGRVLTGTDVAVALGRMELGSIGVAQWALRGGRAEQAWAAVQARLEQCVEAAKTQVGRVVGLHHGSEGGALAGGLLPLALIDLSMIPKPENPETLNPDHAVRGLSVV